MPIFIIFGLGFSYLIQIEDFLLNYLVSPLLMHISLIIALANMAGMLLGKIPDRFGYDLFFVTVVIFWFNDWRPEFGKDSPIFFFFPLYFVFMIAFVSLFFISQRDKIDDLSIRYMRMIDQRALFKPWVLMLCVLGSLEETDHYLLFPVLMTLLIMRFTLSRCLKKTG